MHNSFNRELSKVQAEEMANIFSIYLELNITSEDINNAVSLFCRIEQNIAGRIAGDVEDYLLNFFVRQKASSVFKGSESQLEIGVLFGGSFIFTMSAVENAAGKFIGVDPLNGYYMNDPERGSKIDKYSNVEVSRDTLVSNLSKMNMDSSRYKIIQGFSSDKSVLEELEGERLSVLFIDGDHTYEGVKKDFELYSPMVVDGGFIIIDNYNDASWTDVKLFCDELMSRDDLEYGNSLIFGRTLVFRKGMRLTNTERYYFSSNYNFVDKQIKKEKRIEARGEKETAKLKKELESVNQKLKYLTERNEGLSKYKKDYLQLKSNPIKFFWTKFHSSRN